MRRYFAVIFFTITLLILSPILIAQVFGGNPSSLKWRQINTDSFRIIFPNGLDSTAFSVASMVQFQQRNIVKSIGDKERKVNIVLQNQMTYSNGYVGLAPFRSEFFLMPPMDATQLGAQNWSDNLAIHEYRHVAQYNNFDVGLSHLFKTFFGQNGQAFANSISVPDWFFEGDAVYNETLLSKQGRGRIPLFMNAFKALYLSNKKYNYQQVRNGSYIHYMPDHYNLGYLLVAYGYDKYGIDFWKKVTHDAASFKGLFYPMQKAIRKYSDLSFKDFRDSAFAYYDQQWAGEPKDALQFTTGIEKRNVVNYQYPYAAGDEKIIALKTDKKHIPQFIELENSKEKIIATRPIANDNYFSYNNGKIIYTKLKPNIRWGYKQSSDIELLDVTTKQKTTITHNQRYFTPDISHNGQLIAAVSFMPDQHSAIHIFDIRGNVLKHFAAKQNHIFSFPKFSQDDQSVFVIERNRIGEMAIQQFNIITGLEKNILPFGNRLIDFPVLYNDTLFFTCTNNGADECWAYILKENKIYKIAQTQLGIYQSFIQNNRLLGSVFTADGYRIAYIPILYRGINNLVSDTLTRLYQTEPKHDYSNVLSTIYSTNYTVTKYPKMYHPVNFHSLQPDVDDPNYTLTLYGENILNTVHTNASYSYNRIEQYHQVGVGTIYGGSFVEPFINGNYIFDRTTYDSKSKHNVRFRDAGWQAGAKLPMNFTSGVNYTFLTYVSSFNQRFVHGRNNRYTNRNINYLSNQIAFVHQSQQAVQQIYPRFAQTFNVLYRNTIDNNAAWQAMAKTSLYFPGILATQSFHVDVAWQKQDTLMRYKFGYVFPFSRGYNLYSFPKMWKYSLNYTLPIICPDAGLGNLLYVKRISANFFYDNTFGKIQKQSTQNFASYGAEISFDMNVWNQEATGFSIRYSRLLNKKLFSKNRWEIILPVNLF